MLLQSDGVSLAWAVCGAEHRALQATTAPGDTHDPEVASHA
jgi:hypothetical protein